METQGKDWKVSNLSFVHGLRLTGSIALASSLLLLASCDGERGIEAPSVPDGTEVGQRGPALQGQRTDGTAFSVESTSGSPTVLVFYRSVQCGLCRVQLEQMTTNLAAYERSGADLIAVTLDSPELSQSSFQEADLGFPVVSVDSATFREWGAIEAEREAPLPATYVIDSDGIVRFRHVGRNASDRTSDAEIVAVLQEIRDS